MKAEKDVLSKNNKNGPDKTIQIIFFWITYFNYISWQNGDMKGFSFYLILVSLYLLFILYLCHNIYFISYTCVTIFTLYPILVSQYILYILYLCPYIYFISYTCVTIFTLYPILVSQYLLYILYLCHNICILFII